MKQQFLKGDVVVFRADREHRPYEVMELHGERLVISDLAVVGSCEEPYADALVLAEPITQFFRYAHLPERLQAVSKPFGDLAADLVVTVPRNPERTVALRKLLEAKDAAVRAALYES